MKLLILDRDGVINQDSDDYVKSAAEWIPLPGSLAAIARANRAGYTVVVATNQSGIGRGLFDLAALEAMHKKMQDALAPLGGTVDRIFYCPHRPDAGCDCRKPRTGLLDRIAAHYGVDLDGVPMIGDSRKDLEAARAVGARPILVRTGKGAATEAGLAGDDDIPVYNDLASAVTALLDQEAQA